MPILKLREVRVRWLWQGGERLCVNWIFVRNSMKAPKAGCAQAAFHFCPSRYCPGQKCLLHLNFYENARAGGNRLALIFCYFFIKKKVDRFYWNNFIYNVRCPNIKTNLTSLVETLI